MASEAFKTLSNIDAVCLLELIHSSLSCNTKDELDKLIGKLNYLVPFDFAMCGLAQMGADGMTKSYEVMNISFPAAWYQIYMGEKYYRIDSVFKKNYTDFNVQYWTDTYNAHVPPPEFLLLKNDFELRDGYTHGTKSLKCAEGSLFSISCKSSVSRKSAEFHRRTAAILIHIVPHLHHALSRIAGQSSNKSTKPLSIKEVEVLNWIKQGKRSWYISVILNISESTVNFHATNIMQKLDAVNRAQAVATAVQLGLIHVD